MTNMTTLHRPHLIVPPVPRKTLADTTWEQRRTMTAAQLIELMGPLHVGHPQYKPRPRGLLPQPNLAGVQPVIARTECGLLAQWKTLLMWVMR